MFNVKDKLEQRFGMGSVKGNVQFAGFTGLMLVAAAPFNAAAGVKAGYEVAKNKVVK